MERNKDSPNLDSKSAVNSRRSQVSEFKDEEIAFIARSPSRPEFLRYKPNRRREILQRRKEEEEEFEYSDEDMEEFEDEGSWCLNLKGVLKFLSLIVVIVLSTLYISSMNSAKSFDSHVLEAFEGLKNGYQKVGNYVFRGEKSFNFYSENKAIMEENQKFSAVGLKEEVIVEEIVELKEELELENEEIELGEAEIVELKEELELENEEAELGKLENGESDYDQKMVKTDLAFEFVIGISILLVITTSLFSVFYFKRKKEGITSSLVLKPQSESTISEKVIPTKKEEIFELCDDIVHSTIDESEKIDHSSTAPSVELLSEFEIHSVPYNSQPSFSEISAMNSTSFGSFTPNKNMIRKEDDEEVRKVMTTTPVRRSSRIRNRGVMSP